MIHIPKYVLTVNEIWTYPCLDILTFCRIRLLKLNHQTYKAIKFKNMERISDSSSSVTRWNITRKVIIHNQIHTYRSIV